ncbi:MAG: hypothetical protein GY938_13170 [Ketobacter sp.]|nr:hypothetical protein [Ketobacter sp.]
MIMVNMDDPELNCVVTAALGSNPEDAVPEVVLYFENEAFAVLFFDIETKLPMWNTFDEPDNPAAMQDVLDIHLALQSLCPSN